jgi:uncharacterized protein YbcI
MDADFEEADKGRLEGGELNAAVTSALVGIHTRYVGRGPKRASTFYNGNVLVTVMYDVMTHEEKSLVRAHHESTVETIRRDFQETMEADFRGAVEQLTGCAVTGFISGYCVEPDILAEVFVLDARL